MIHGAAWRHNRAQPKHTSCLAINFYVFVLSSGFFEKGNARGFDINLDVWHAMRRAGSEHSRTLACNWWKIQELLVVNAVEMKVRSWKKGKTVLFAILEKLSIRQLQEKYPQLLQPSWSPYWKESIRDKKDRTSLPKSINFTLQTLQTLKAFSAN